MEENVALDTTKQKKFIKSIKGIKKLIKKNENVNPGEDVKPKVEKQKIKRQRPERGLVYLSHIPHGFYEHEMTQYFKQFGMVTNARVIRSKRTGNSKGFAFVEFKEPAVGEIVAETMNNYLMGKRLIKAAYIPPEKQKPRAMRKHWSRFNNPGRDARLKQKKKHNENKDEKGDLNRARKIISNINKTKKKLSELGISYDFFTPVDVPEALKDSLNGNENVETNIKDSNTKVDKKSKKEKASNTEIKDNKSKKDKIQEIQVKPEKNKKPVKGESKKESTVKVEEKKPDLTKNQNKKNKVTPEAVVNKKEQKHKQQKLNEAGVKSVENFIKVQEESGDSDSSLEFDSDEYEKMLEDESGDDSDADEGSDGEDDEGSEDDDDDDESDEEEEIVPPPKKSKGKPAPIVALPQKQGKKQKGPAPPQPKRKVPQNPAPAAVSPQKPKFEKQSQQPMKKHFKKKKY